MPVSGKSLFSKIEKYVDENIQDFNRKCFEDLSNINLNSLIKRKNPYLFKAKNYTLGSEIVKSILDAHLSSREETIFGQFLEGLAIYINKLVYNGNKSAAEGLDLEFETANKLYIVSIKSGPNWGNSDQIKKMIINFDKAKKVLRQNKSNQNREIIAVNGCCYGRDRSPDKGSYFKYCGQAFWFLISGDDNMYSKIIQPLGKNAKKHNDDYKAKYAASLNLLTAVFIKEFCHPDGSINWEKLLTVNSAR